MTTNKMKVQYLDPKDLKVPEVRITSAFDDEIYSMFKGDIEKTGINQPLLIAKENETLWVIDGKNRRDQALLQGIKSVPCVILEMTLKEMQLRNLVLNRLRGKTKASEEVAVIRDLSENHGCGIDEIVEKTGMKQERVEQLLLIGGADPEVWKALDSERIKVCHAYQLSRLVDASAQMRMLRVVLQYQLTCTFLKEEVDMALKIVAERKTKNDGVPAVAPPQIPTAACSVCHNEYPVRELAAPVLCKGCYATLIMSFEEGKKQYEAEQEKKRKIAEEVAGGEVDAG